ncbi:hypothetical protein NQD34_011723, partial [Periophthalmus magnuspinnatus]
PAEPQRASYINRKLSPSVILQGLCDSWGTFLDVFLENPRSVHDALVLWRSPMYKESLQTPAGYKESLCNCTFPCLTGQITDYNRHHAKVRRIIKHTFDVVKTSCRSIFLRAVEVQSTLTPIVVRTCCILYNIYIAAEGVL